MIRVTTVITGAAVVGGGVNTLYFNGVLEPTAEAAVEFVHDFWDRISDKISSSLTLQVEGTVPVVTPADGTVTAIHSVTAPAAVVGQDTNAPLPYANQGLIQWHTSGVANGRQIRGRTFVPGPAEFWNSTAGIPELTYVADLQGTADGLIAEGPPSLVVWHRPGPAGPGSEAVVNSATVWNKWAILRSRRD